MQEYAVNIADLTSHSAFALALGPFLTRKQVAAEPDMLDGLAARVNQAASLAQFAVLVEIMRRLPGGQKHQLRIYRRVGMRWERVEQITEDAQ